MQLTGEALTFDDVSLVPAFSEVLPGDVNLQTRLTRDITLGAPLVSAAMDTVTEARLAIAMAQEGGIGVIHKNMTLQKQAAQVLTVKKYEAGVIKDPITVNPNTTIREVLELTHRHNISGVPVVDGNELVGIVTSRDMRFEKRLDDPVRNIMTCKEKLVTVQENASQDEVMDLLHHHRIEKVLVVNDDFELCGLVTVKDIQKSTDFPNAAKDSQERLLVAAAVGVGGDTEERVAALVAANVDVIVVDTAHGHSKGVLERIRWVRKNYPEVQIIGGNVTTGEGALALVDAGVCTAEDIDKVVRLTFALRLPALGPMENMDLVGLDAAQRIQKYLLPDLARNTEPAACLKDRIESGQLGMKSGQGFYDWSERNAEKLVNNLFNLFLDIRLKLGKLFVFVILDPDRDLISRTIGKLPNIDGNLLAPGI